MGTTSSFQTVRSETNYVHGTVSYETKQNTARKGSSSRLVFQFEEARALLVLKQKHKEELDFGATLQQEKHE